MNYQRVLYTGEVVHVLIYVFAHINMFLHGTNTYYCVILPTFLLKTVYLHRCSLLVQKCLLGGAAFTKDKDNMLCNERQHNHFIILGNTKLHVSTKTQSFASLY